MACKDGTCGCGHGKGKEPSDADKMDSKTQQKIQELQVLEQQFQQFMMQKNAFSIEADEVENTIIEVEKSSGEISRIVGGQVIIKSTKEEVLESLKKKKELIEKRLNSIENQERAFSERIEELREEIIKKLS